MADQDPAAMPPPAEEENVDQFYDDGGETFLPADHVSISRTAAAPKLDGLVSVTDDSPIAVSPYSP